MGVPTIKTMKLTTYQICYEAIKVTNPQDRRLVIEFTIYYILASIVGLIEITLSNNLVLSVNNLNLSQPTDDVFKTLTMLMIISFFDHYFNQMFLKYITKITSIFRVNITKKYYQLFTIATFEWLNSNEFGVNKRKEAIENASAECGYMIRPLLDYVLTILYTSFTFLFIAVSIGPAIMPFLICMFLLFYFYISVGQDKFAQEWAKAVVEKTEIRSNIQDIHNNGHDRIMHGETHQLVDSIIHPTIKIANSFFILDKTHAFFFTMSEYIPRIFQYLLLAFTVYNHQYGTSILVIRSMSQLSNMIHSTTNISGNWKRTKSECEPLINMIEKMEEKPMTIAHHIKFVNDFNLSISGIDLNIEGGTHLRQTGILNLNKTSKILLDGRSGCGKSTLMNFLCDSYINKGKLDLFLNNNEINTTDVIPYRSFFQFGSGTLPVMCTWQELIIGNNELDDEILNKVIQITHTEGKITSSGGMNKQVGKKLSGGETTRFSLARALYRALIKQYPLFIMDEPDNGLDDTQAKEIISNIFQLDICIFITLHKDCCKALPFTHRVVFEDYENNPSDKGKFTCSSM